MRSSFKGFTLIELIIVVAIVGIISAFAYPSYMEHIRNGRRTEAKAALVDLSSFMERYYTEKMVYTGAALPYNLVPKDGGASSAYYNLAIADITNATFRIEATPVGAQNGDKCGVLSIDNRGIKSATQDSCW